MKRIIALMLALVLLCTPLVACGEDDEKDTATTTASQWNPDKPFGDTFGGSRYEFPEVEL